MSSSGCLSLACRDNRNNTAVAVATVEVHRTIYEGIERVVLTHAYVATGIVNRAALTNDDVACYASLSAIDLNA